MFIKKSMRLAPLAGAVAAVVFSASAMANEQPKPTDILTDGWQVNGYIRAGWRVSENGTTTSSEYGKPDYALAGTVAKNPNQVEFNISKNTTFQNGVWSQLALRAEYGNGDHSFYSSSGSEDMGKEGEFEIKEAFIRLGGFSYLPEGAEIWAGRRFLNREAGILSGEFWKQSSGAGFGYEQKTGDIVNGIAVVSVDTDAHETIKTQQLDENGVPKPDPNNPGGFLTNSITNYKKGAGKTIHSLDLYSYNHQLLGGSWNFDLKIMQVGDKDKWNEDDATKGFGGAITYKRDYYGFDGWTTTALAYGKGLAANRGVNFGHWSGGTSTTDSENGQSWFFTSYGVLNINDRWQMGSEITYLRGEKIWGLGNKATDEGDSVDRLLIAARPTYKVNDNFRWEFTASYGYEKDYWDSEVTDGPRVATKTDVYAAEIAAVFTVNSDYFGRPQIKPFFTYMVKESDNKAVDNNGWGDEFDKNKRTWQTGVEAEIWF